METTNRLYHEEPSEYIEEVKQKQEATKKLLYALLIQPEIIASFKTSHGINIVPESVEIIQIDLEDYSVADDRLISDMLDVTRKRCLFVAKLNEKSYQIEYTCEFCYGGMTIHLEPAEYNIDYVKCKSYTITKDGKKKVILSKEGT
ncbi:hypothetical protein [Methanosarcina siciliae]|uniref:hypothetical protein n=1 Tax=Methanosarcina siciliae TaxID=38027 RepID=UPI0011E5B5C9|nr:hypothetical protein [Methanosarcina siciliae]